MQILTSTIREFQKLSSGIKTNPILPICAYLKITDKSIIKTNLHQFIDFSISSASKGEIFLVDEKLLYNLVNVTNSELIKISASDKHLVIEDERQSLKHQLQDITHFPAIPSAENEYIPISDETIAAISVANNLTIEENIPTIKSAVMVGKNHVAATDHFIAYKEGIAENVTVLLMKQVAAIISKLTNVEYSTTENYDFFKTSKFIFGFSKSELNYMNIQEKIILNGSALESKINKQDIISFCDMAINSSYSNLSPVCKMESELLTMDDDGFDIHLKKEMPSLKCKKAFNFNPILMNKLLKSIPGEEINLYFDSNKYFITDDTKTYLSLIMGIYE